MTNYDRIKSMNVLALAAWLDEHGNFDNSPWINRFDSLYCKKCKPIMCHHEETPEREFPCAYCELENKCRYFPDMNRVPNNEDIIKMWLESECNTNE